MEMLNTLLVTLPNARVTNVSIGLHWTAVVVDIDGDKRCGLASTLHNAHHHNTPDVPQAGDLESLSVRDLAAFIQADQPTLVSVGAATVNALLPQHPETWQEINAEDVIAKYGARKSVVLIGHFPFISRLRPRVGKMDVLELAPQEGDLPASAANKILPQADVVAITSMTLLNRTLDGLLKLCKPQAMVILLGPTTPLSPILFDYGIDLLCGSVVIEIDPVLQTLRQGGNFRQIHRAGVQLVSLARPASKG